jgi:hypothetical protein
MALLRQGYEKIGISPIVYATTAPGAGVGAFVNFVAFFVF